MGDEIAGLADLVKGKLDAVPVAVVRGLGEWTTTNDGPGAAGLTRAENADWFRYGHVEAVRAALGVEPGTDAVPPPPVWPEPLSVRLARAMALAVASDPALWSALTITPDDEGAPTTLTIADAGAGLVAAGVFAQRLVTALWAEGVTGHLDIGLDRTVVRWSTTSPSR